MNHMRLVFGIILLLGLVLSPGFDQTPVMGQGNSNGNGNGGGGNGGGGGANTEFTADLEIEQCFPDSTCNIQVFSGITCINEKKGGEIQCFDLPVNTHLWVVNFGLGAEEGPCCAEETFVSRLDLRPINDDPIAFDLRLITSDDYYSDYDTLAATPCRGDGSTPLEIAGDWVSMMCDPDVQVPPDPEPRLQVRKTLKGSRSEVVDAGFDSPETLSISIMRCPCPPLP